MTTNARLVLNDCRTTLDELQRCETSGRPHPDLMGEWRIRWFTSVVLLRTVGHVLENVDSKSSDDWARCIQEQYQRWKASRPHPAIYWEFIKAERDFVVKEYLIRIGGIIRATGLATTSITVDGAIYKTDPSGYATIVVPRFSAGHFQGRAMSATVQEAADWWRDQLDALDRAHGASCA